MATRTPCVLRYQPLYPYHLFRNPLPLSYLPRKLSGHYLLTDLRLLRSYHSRRATSFTSSMMLMIRVDGMKRIILYRVLEGWSLVPCLKSSAKVLLREYEYLMNSPLLYSGLESGLPRLALGQDHPSQYLSAIPPKNLPKLKSFTPSYFMISLQNVLTS